MFLGFPCGLAGKESICNAGDLSLIPGLGRLPGEGKGYLLQRLQRVRPDWKTSTSLHLIISNFLITCVIMIWGWIYCWLFFYPWWLNSFFWSHKLKSMAVVETQCRHGQTRSLGIGRSFLCVILGSDVWESQSYIKSSAPSKVKKHKTNFNYRPYAENIETRKQLRKFNKQRHHGVMGKLFCFFCSKVTLLMKIL